MEEGWEWRGNVGKNARGRGAGGKNRAKSFSNPGKSVTFATHLGQPPAARRQPIQFRRIAAFSASMAFAGGVEQTEQQPRVEHRHPRHNKTAPRGAFCGNAAAPTAASSRPGFVRAASTKGKMPERSIGTVSKTVVPLRVPRVRIPVFPL